MEIYSLQEKMECCNSAIVYQHKRKVGYMDSQVQDKAYSLNGQGSVAGSTSVAALAAVVALQAVPVPIAGHPLRT